MEIWNDIPGYEGYYQASSYGQIRSVERVVIDSVGRTRFYPSTLLKQMISDRGYHQVNLYKSGIRTLRVNRLIAAAFHDNPLGKPQVNHIDGQKSNNKANNLEWVTSSENVQHSYSSGLRIGRRGEQSNLSKLSVTQVNEILASKDPQKVLAKRYQTSISNISLIVNRKSWVYDQQ